MIRLQEDSMTYHLTLKFTAVQRQRLEAAARSAGVDSQTFITNTLMSAVEAIEASGTRERELALLLLSGSSWDEAANTMNIPTENLRQAGVAIATQMFRGDR
jgi:hypothetical protein